MARIFIIDDNDDLRRMYRALLEDEGHAVDECAHGPECVSRFHAHDAELLVCDPFGRDGKASEAIAEIVRMAPNTPMLVITGARYSAGIEASPDRYGAAHVLTKPFGLEELRRAVETLLGEQQPF